MLASSATWKDGGETTVTRGVRVNKLLGQGVCKLAGTTHADLSSKTHTQRVWNPERRTSRGTAMGR